MAKLTAIKIRYTGEKLPKVVELPVPFISISGKTGEVICNPDGIFPVEDGRKLLELSGPDGLFQEVEEIFENGVDHEELDLQEQSDPMNDPAPAQTMKPKIGKRYRTAEQNESIRRMIGSAMRKRGKRRRARRSDFGVPRGNGSKTQKLEADTAIAPQANQNEPTPETPAGLEVGDGSRTDDAATGAD